MRKTKDAGLTFNLDEVEDLESRNQLGEKVFPPWEQEILANFNFNNVEEIVNNRDILGVYKSFEAKSKVDDHLDGFAGEIDTKYKCHPKEIEREKRIN